MSAEGPIRDSAVAQTVAITFRFLILAMVVVVVAWLVSGFREVQPGHRLLVKRFGRIDHVADSGLVVAWPFDQVIDVPNKQMQLTLRIDRLSLADDQQAPSRERTEILTGDVGIANLSAVVTYQVEAPEDYYLVQEQLKPALVRLFCQAAIAATSCRTLDVVMAVHTQEGHEHEDLAQDHAAMHDRIVDTLNQRCLQLKLGIKVTRLDLVAQLPTEARNAFEEVSTAESTAATDIADAKAFAETRRVAADSIATATIENAKAAARDTLTEAHQRTDEIAALLAATSSGERLQLMTRIYRDHMDDLLAKLHVVAIDPHQSVRIALPER